MGKETSSGSKIFLPFGSSFQKEEALKQKHMEVFSKSFLLLSNKFPMKLVCTNPQTEHSK